jgi:CBS domain-containing protein
MIGSVAALCVTVLLLRRSILTEKLDRRGQHVVREYGVDIFELSRVADVMDTNPPFASASPEIVVTYPDEKLSVAIAKMLASAVERLPVVNREDPCRVVGYLGHANILAARGRLHKEEELRERGPIFPCKRPQDVR